MNYNAKLTFQPSTVLRSLLILLSLLVLLPACTALGPVIIDAPAPDLEGGSTTLATVCGKADSPPDGAFVRVVTPAGEFDEFLENDGSYSIEVCLEVGQDATVQFFDAESMAISAIVTISRETDDDTNLCPEPTNAEPTCP